MTLLYLDTFSGISGDMMLGLLVDLGIELRTLQNELAKLPIGGYALSAGQDQRHGIGGGRVTVKVTGPQPHRTWTDIDSMLSACALDPAIKNVARQIFRRLGEAESTVHRVPLEQVHFHEVGAVDAVVDIVGTAIGIGQLNVDRILCAPLPLSSGLTRGQHGSLPLPAPATLEILKGAPVRDASCDRELVTPTGAAIAATIAEFGPLPEMTPTKIGYGVGGWELEDRPNLLRGILGNEDQVDGLESDTVSVIETHLDDAQGEWLGALLSRLLAAGALDAAFTPVQMKKNRPGIKLTVISPVDQTDRLARLILHESSAIGVRIHQSRRLKLKREVQTIETALGAAQVKLIFDGQRLLRITPEYDSCQALARQHDRPLPEIYRLVAAEANRRFGLEV